MKELSKEQQEKYRLPISKGYFKNYSVLWRNTALDGVWLWKHPSRVRPYETLMEITGHTPEWKDLTDLNIRMWVEMISEYLCQNSVHTVCSELKAVINEYVTSVDIPSRQYTKILNVPRDESEAVYLSTRELQKIRDYIPMSDDERIVVSLFMIEALTGARHVDSERMTMNNVNEETNVLHYTAKKTRKSVSVPVHKWLQDYLPKDNEELSLRKKICLMSYNRTIRRICKNVGIKQTVTIYRRGKETTAPKYTFVSSHTARRSFATNLHLWGAEVGLVCNLMGHSSPEMTMRYIKENASLPEKVLKFFG